MEAWSVGGGEPYNTTRVRDFRVKEMIYQNEEKPKPREGH